MKQAYDDVREQLSKLSRSLKILETRALKQTFSTNEIASKVSYGQMKYFCCICTHLSILYKALFYLSPFKRSEKVTTSSQSE